MILLVDPISRMIVRAISSIVTSCGLPMFTGSLVFALHEADDASHEIGDVAEAARLRAIPEHRHVLMANACEMKAGTARPSRRRIRGP